MQVILDPNAPTNIIAEDEEQFDFEASSEEEEEEEEEIRDRIWIDD